jgi:four helix bundle protein
MAFKFENLNVWQRSLDFSVEIYELTEKFPKQEMFGLTSQINRAADSISLNIAEGSTGQSNAEFSKFLGYSIRSGVEVVGCLYIAKKKKFITQQDFDQHYKAAESIIIMNQALRKKLR